MSRARHSFLHEAERFVFAADSAAQVAHLRQTQAAHEAQEAEYAALPQSVRDATPVASSGHLGQQQYLALAEWIRGLPVAQFDVMKRNRRGRMQARTLKCTSLTIQNVKPNSAVAWSRPYLDIASVCLLSRSVVQLQFQDVHKPAYQLHTRAALGVLEQIETRWNAHRALAKMKLSIDIARQLGSHLYASTPRGRSFMPGAPNFVLPTAAPAAGAGVSSSTAQASNRSSGEQQPAEPGSPTARKAATVMGGSDTQRLQFAVRSILYNPHCPAGKTRLRYLVQKLPDLCADTLGVPVRTLAVPDGGARIDQAAFIKKLKKKHPRVAQIVQCREELLPSAAHLTGGSGKAVLPFALVAEAPAPRRSLWDSTKRFAKRVLSSKRDRARPATSAMERPRSAALARTGSALRAHERHDSYMSCQSGPPSMLEAARRSGTTSSTGSLASSRPTNSSSSSSSSSSSDGGPDDTSAGHCRPLRPMVVRVAGPGAASLPSTRSSLQSQPPHRSSSSSSSSSSTPGTVFNAEASQSPPCRSTGDTGGGGSSLALEAGRLRHLPSQPAAPDDAEWSERTAAAERIVKQQRSLRLSMEVSNPQRVQPRAARVQGVRQSISAGRHSLIRVSQRFKLSQKSMDSASSVQAAAQSESPPSMRARPRSVIGSAADMPAITATRARSMSLDMSTTPTRATRALSAAGLLAGSPLRPLPAATHAAASSPPDGTAAVAAPAPPSAAAAVANPRSSSSSICTTGSTTSAPLAAVQQQQPQQQPATEPHTGLRSYSGDSSSSGASDTGLSRLPSRCSSSVEAPAQPTKPAALELCELTQQYISALHVHAMSKYATQLQHSAPGLPMEADSSTAQARAGQLSLHSISAVVLREVEMALYMPARDVLAAAVALSVDTVAEAKLVGYCRDMRSWSQAAFSVPRHLQAADDWSGAILELREVERLVLPSDKLRALVATARAICRVYEIVQVHRTGQAAKPLGADDFFPIFAFVVCRAQLRAPMRLCALIHCLAQPQLLGGEAGYYLTVLEAALEHLQTMGCDADLTETWAMVGQPQHQHHRPGRVSLARVGSRPQL